MQIGPHRSTPGLLRTVGAAIPPGRPAHLFAGNSSHGKKLARGLAAPGALCSRSSFPLSRSWDRTAKARPPRAQHRPLYPLHLRSCTPIPFPNLGRETTAGGEHVETKKFLNGIARLFESSRADQARFWAENLTRLHMRTAGQIGLARTIAEETHGFSRGFLARLRYWPPQSLAPDLVERLREAVIAAAEHEKSQLEQQIEIARGLGVRGDHPAMRAAVAAMRDPGSPENNS